MNSLGLVVILTQSLGHREVRYGSGVADLPLSCRVGLEARHLGSGLGRGDAQAGLDLGQ